VETAARRGALAVAARAVARRLNADHTDPAGPTLPCRCGHTAHYAGRKAKTVLTALGELRLERAYYPCNACRSGFCPRDRVLGVDGVSLSPAVTRMVGTAAARVSFAEGSALLGALAGLPVNAKQVERTAEALGREIAADEQQQVVPAEEAESAPPLYLGMDGTGVPMRKEEVEGRPGTQADGSAKTREVKRCTVWSAEGRDTDATCSAFARRVEREARRRGVDRANRRAVLGDGAPWIWNIAGEYFPAAIQIVDRFHAKAHLSGVAKVIYGATSDLGAAWAKARHDELDAGQLHKIVAALATHSRSCPDASKRDEIRKCIGYVWGNRRRMRYPAFRAQGLCTSTAVVEAGCKVAIGTRLKRAGMHWTVRGANAIIALRCSKLSGRFEDFWERRAQSRVAS